MKKKKAPRLKTSEKIPYPLLQTLRYYLMTGYDAPPPPSGNRADFNDTCCASWYIRKGSVKVSWDGGAFTAQKGDWVFCDPVLRRTQQFSPDASILSIRFQIRWEGQDLFQIPGPPHKALASRIPELLNRAEALVRQLSLHGGLGIQQAELSPLDHAHIQELFMAFVVEWHESLEALGHYPKTPQVQDQRVRRAMEVLMNHVGLGVIPYDALSRESGLSRAQLDRLFLVNLGQTPHQIVEQRCLREAERLLVDARLSVKEIASNLRFSDSSHFAKWFRRQAGISPRLYRTFGNKGRATKKSVKN